MPSARHTGGRLRFGTSLLPTMPPTYRPPGAQSQRQARQQYDTRRRAAKPWRNWLNSKAWRDRRAYQLTMEPLCRFCAERGKAVPATVADHITPHRGNWDRFIAGPLQSLCTTCHSSRKQKLEAAEGKPG